MAPRRPTAPRPTPGRGAPRPGAAPTARPVPPARGTGRPASTSRPGAPARGSAPGRSGPRAGTAAGSGRVAGQGRGAPRSRRTPLVRPVTMVSGVLVILALLLAPYVRPWLAQRSQIAAGAQEVDRLQLEVDALQAERARWDDPAYVKAQARERLWFVMPGEVGYVVLDDRRKPAARPDPRRAEVAVPRGGDEAWYGTLWESVRIAGDPSTELARSRP